MARWAVAAPGEGAADRSHAAGAAGEGRTTHLQLQQGLRRSASLQETEMRRLLRCDFKNRTRKKVSSFFYV